MILISECMVPKRCLRAYITTCESFDTLQSLLNSVLSNELYNKNEQGNTYLTLKRIPNILYRVRAIVIKKYCQKGLPFICF